MTKKFWTSLVLGLTLSTPALMVGCGEETKTETPAAPVAPSAPAAPAAPGGDAAKMPTPAAAPAK